MADESILARIERRGGTAPRLSLVDPEAGEAPSPKAPAASAGERYEFQGESATLTVGSGFVWGGRLGLDIPVGDSAWDVSLGARYLSSSIDGDDPDGQPIEIDLDPFLLTVGFGYRF